MAADEATQNGQLVRPLVDTPNEDILNAIRNQASPDFQRRIPAATKGNVRHSLENMMNFPALRNEFYDALVNRICGVYVNQLSWTNPLAEFKRSAQQYGKTYEEAAVGLVKARVYDPKQEYLGDEIFGTYKPDVETAFHTVNREEFYPITINESQVRYAFTNGDGLGQLTSQIMEAPRTSDNLDEYLHMVHLFPEYSHLGGYYRVHVDDVTDTAISDQDMQSRARQLLRNIRQMVNTLPIKPSTRYNARHMPSVVNREDLILFMTPEVHAAIDVNALAVLFNEDYARTNNRIIDITAQDVGIKGFQCILTTREFFFVWDYYYGTQGGVPNPISLGTNYFLHHKEAISLSPFVPAILFWTGAPTLETVDIPKNVKAGTPKFQIRLAKYGNPSQTPTNVKRGDVVQVVGKVSEDGNPYFDVQGGIRYEIASEVKSQFTRIDNTGILTVGIDEGASDIKVRCSTTYIDPEHPEVPSDVSDTLTVPVVGDGIVGFNPSVVTKLDITPTGDKTVAVEGEVKLNAIATMTDGRTPDITNMVIWESADPAKVKVRQDGTVTGVSAGGPVVVSARVFGMNATVNVTVSGTAARSSEWDDGEVDPDDDQE